MKKPFVLTPSEEDLMNIFWVENRPLTSVELTELSKDHGWNQEYILNMLRSIKKKGWWKSAVPFSIINSTPEASVTVSQEPHMLQSWQPPSESTKLHWLKPSMSW